jgi:FkbM family methyltransferase
MEIFVLGEYAFDGPENSLIIDCGANIGMSVMYFKRTHPNSTIIAFEADDKAFEYLSRNIETNGLTDVHLNKTAVFDRDGEITWYSALHDTPSSLLEMSVFQSSLGEQKLKSTTVACAMLSSFIDRPVNLLKLDVQGAETKVLEDLKNTDKIKFVNDMIIEYHFDSVNNPLGKLISILEENGFYVSIHAYHQVKLPPYYKTRGESYFFVIFASRIKGEKAPVK